MIDPAQLREAVERALPTATAIRQELHRHPETAFEEKRTASLVADRLAQLGATVQCVGDTGVVGILRGSLPGRVLALRADMDALPLEERTGAPYASAVPGKMHACGHDGHTACLLGTAEVLCTLRDALPGTVKLLFQPAEERGSGAAQMVQAGVLCDPDVQAILALHSWPDLEVGRIGLREGPMLASVDRFHVVVRGRGGHGAHPDACVDPILIAARLVDSLQSVVSREVDPLEPAVVTVGSIHGGTVPNIIPERVTLQGTVRTLSEETRSRVRTSFHRLVEGVAAAHGAQAEVEYRAELPVTRNDVRAVTFLREVGEALLGAENVTSIARPSMGGEDFSLYLQHVPGAMFRLGVGPGCAPLHSPLFDFRDAALRPGMLVLAGAALKGW